MNELSVCLTAGRNNGWSDFWNVTWFWRVSPTVKVSDCDWGTSVLWVTTDLIYGWLPSRVSGRLPWTLVTRIRSRLIIVICTAPCKHFVVLVVKPVSLSFCWRMWSCNCWRTSTPYVRLKRQLVRDSWLPNSAIRTRILQLWRQKHQMKTKDITACVKFDYCRFRPPGSMLHLGINLLHTAPLLLQLTHNCITWSFVFNSY